MGIPKGKRLFAPTSRMVSIRIQYQSLLSRFAEKITDG
jgi:hypothetical protein